MAKIDKVFNQFLKPINKEIDRKLKTRTMSINILRNIISIIT